MRKGYKYFIFACAILVNSSSLALEADKQAEIEEIFTQINQLDQAQQSALMKKLFKYKSDIVVNEISTTVHQLKQQMNEELNDPKLQESMKKAKEKLNELFQLFNIEPRPTKPPQQKPTTTL
jgi:hypothetical protein